jgi:hypothetical protein
MPDHWTNRSQTLAATGAAAGSVVCGSAHSNEGLRLLLQEAQARGADGPVRGPLVILDAGHNKHSLELAPLKGRPTDAAEVLRAIRQRSAYCVNVVNTNILVAEQQEVPPRFPSRS